jgi:hypothetical protein
MNVAKGCADRGPEIWRAGSESAGKFGGRFFGLKNEFKFDRRFEEEEIRTVEFTDFG